MQGTITGSAAFQRDQPPRSGPGSAVVCARHFDEHRSPGALGRRLSRVYPALLQV